MRRIPQKLRKAFPFLPLLLCAGITSAQCPDNDATLPAHPISYPSASDQYAVQYQIDGGKWTNALVYISYYGKTYASPYRGDSGYIRDTTSMSFVSIPARANARVQIRVTMLPTLSTLAGGAFRASDHVSARPTPKLVDIKTADDGTVQLSTFTDRSFNGEQFILMWDRGTNGGGVEGLAFYLNPPYPEPQVDHSVKAVNSWTDLDGADLSAYQTLDFESLVDPTGLPIPIQLGGDGTQAYNVPDNIVNVFLGQDAWVQGKLSFTTNPARRHIYGPGVLDGSQFNYLNRDCLKHDGSPTDDGLYSLSSEGSGGNLTNFFVDGIIISDQNHAANDPFFSSTLNNVKTLGWNSNNAALRLNDSTTASNVFIRSSDDSLMDWGSPVTVTNATVWQGYNGGVVSLGWSNNSVGDHNLIDGLFVVKTDWQMPNAQSWMALSQPGPPNPLDSQNNGVFVSLMVPSTQYGKQSPPVFRNIFVEDPPQVLFSLKIDPSVNCPPDKGFCSATFLQQQRSYMSLKIENLYSPQSIIKNSIGFETIPAGYIANRTDTVSYFPSDFTLKGTMKIDLSNVWIRTPSGFILPLLNRTDAEWFGKVSTNGDVDLK